MKTRKELEAQANAIEKVMDRCHMKGRIMGGEANHRLVRFDMATRYSIAAMNQAELPGHLAIELGAQTVRIYRKDGHYCIEIPLEASRLLRLTHLQKEVEREEIAPMTAILGADTDKCPLLVRMDKLGHLLLTGDTGAGKTSLMRAMLASLAFYTPVGDMKMLLIDPKTRGLGPLAALPHAGKIISDIDEIASHLAIVSTIVGRRLRTGETGPAYVVAVDELADLPSGQARTFFTLLLEKGARVGVHLVAGTRRPGPADCFPLRAVGAVESAADAPHGSEAEKLTGRGDFNLSFKGEYIRFQAAWLGQKELASVLSYTGGNNG